jgi:hypothetical protein
MSRYIVKAMNLEMPKCLIIWYRGSMYHLISKGCKMEPITYQGFIATKTAWSFWVTRTSEATHWNLNAKKVNLEAFFSFSECLVSCEQVKPWTLCMWWCIIVDIRQTWSVHNFLDWQICFRNFWKLQILKLLRIKKLQACCKCNNALIISRVQYMS